MTELTTAVAAENWALFSGDWNPIHFDLDAARSVGADRLVVHGMLALLKVKQATSMQVGRSSCGQQFNAFFRIPALQGSELHLDLRQKKAGVNFTLQSDEYVCIRGNHGDSDAWNEAVPAAPAGQARRIDKEVVTSRYKQFNTLFPFVTHRWVFLDALLFSDFLGDYFKTELPMSKGFAPVQMSHRVNFDREAIEALDVVGGNAPTLTYTVRKIEGPNAGADRFGIAVLTLFSEFGPLMQTEVGLLAKTISQPQLDLQIE